MSTFVTVAHTTRLKSRMSEVLKNEYAVTDGMYGLVNTWQKNTAHERESCKDMP